MSAEVMQKVHIARSRVSLTLRGRVRRIYALASTIEGMTAGDRTKFLAREIATLAMELLLDLPDERDEPDEREPGRGQAGVTGKEN